MRLYSSILFTLFASLCLSAYAQTQPGGVGASAYWSKHSVKPSSSFTLRQPHANGLTLFCVYSPDTLAERSLWSLGGRRADDLAFTTRRMADLSAGRFINYATDKRTTPQIYTYNRRYMPADSLLRQGRIIIGGHRSAEIPARKLMDSPSEIILYERVLTHTERLRVESYLALRHGIAIEQTIPTPYLDSQEAVIWDGALHRSHSHAIAGIGRDDASGLLQLSSESASDPHLLRISSLDSLANHSFLIWGDNYGKLQFQSLRGAHKRLMREWKVVSTGAHRTERRVDISFNTHRIEQIDPLAPGECYWLAVDTSGKGEYKVSSTSYYLAATGADGMVRFCNVNLASDSCEHSTFTLVAAPDLFVNSTIEPPHCLTGRLGSMEVGVIGGVAPFRVQVKSLTAPYSESRTSTSRLFTFSELEQGLYSMTTTDSRGRHAEQEFLIANSDLPHVPYFAPLTLKSGKSQWVNVPGIEKMHDCSFQWQFPDGTLHDEESFRATRAGVYTLTVTNSEGCSTQRELEVRGLPDRFFDRIVLSPNPTPNGHVAVTVALNQVSDMRLWIQNIYGQTFNQLSMRGDSYYHFPLYLPASGVWFVVLQVEEEQKIVKVIRK